MARRTNLAGRAGRWSAAHWKTATFGWIVFAVICVVVGSMVGAVKLTDVEYASGQAARAESMLQQAGFKTPATESVLIQSKAMIYEQLLPTVAVAHVVEALDAQPNVTNIVSPIGNPNAGLISKDHHSVLVQFDVKGEADAAHSKIAPVLAAIARVQKANPGVTVEEFGRASSDYSVNEAFKQDMTRAEYTSLPLTLAILLVAFGALVAAGLPVLLAFSAVLAATGLNALASHVIHTADATSSVILMVGMAVGVDYSLFYLQREREERRGGSSPHESLLRTAATSGQAVLISGATVLIAMAGMLFAGNAIFTTMGAGTILVVLCALIGSLSVLPALLHKLGDRVDLGKVPYFYGRRGQDRFFSAAVRVVLRRPVVSVVLSTALLVALALPALQLHTKLPSYTDFPKDLPIVQAFKDVQRAFPGSQTPVVLVVRGNDVTTPRYRKAYAAFRSHSVATGEFFPPFHVFVNPDKTVARVEFSIAGKGDDKVSNHALQTLRNDVIPPIAEELPQAEWAVTGATAGSYDFNQRMKQRMPIVFAFVLGLAFLLMLLAFRSIVIPIKTVLLNLLSVWASYGILVAVFQHSWAEGLMGFTSNGAITSWLPLFLFVILFGLSMDYHVFILSRVKERVDAGESTEDAVAHAISRTAGTITSAALVMVGVFALFASVRLLPVKQLGFGLAVAVFLDATVVRAVLLPSAMKLLGDWNWYLPRSLEWLPSLEPEEKQPRQQPSRAVLHG
ncbi:MAG: MMPL family transporter [Gaiellaceae bacterium]